jgi:1-acyl-sn-glycerol-3-phosphate acyltransferase
VITSWIILCFRWVRRLLYFQWRVRGK